jgi:hypothetical protein
MKKLLALLLSLFFLSSTSVFSDDISDFQIEGISIGDSLLDYMTKDEILEGIERTKNVYLHLNEPKKYAEVWLLRSSKTYKHIGVYIKNNSTSQNVTNNNDEYIILGLRGATPYNNDFDSCIVKRDEIADEISKLFPSEYKWESTELHPADPSGNSIIDGIYFNFDSGARAKIYCSDWEETLRIKNNWSDYFNITFNSEEIITWLTDY